MQYRQHKTLAIVNNSGVVQERYGYTPYGVTTVYSPTYSVRSGSSFDWTYLYTGRELDWETHLYYFRNRMYDPVLGRFLTRDPIGCVDGMSLYCAYFVPTALDPSGMLSPPVIVVGTGPQVAVVGTLVGSHYAGQNYVKPYLIDVSVDWFGPNLGPLPTPPDPTPSPRPVQEP